jgi:hypothetical protein
VAEAPTVQEGKSCVLAFFGSFALHVFLVLFALVSNVASLAEAVVILGNRIPASDAGVNTVPASHPDRRQGKQRKADKGQ